MMSIRRTFIVLLTAMMLLTSNITAFGEQSLGIVDISAEKLVLTEQDDIYDVKPMKVTVKLSDGTAYIGSYDDVSMKLYEKCGVTLTYTSEQSSTCRWTAGGSYKAYLVYDNQSTGYDVSIDKAELIGDVDNSKDIDKDDAITLLYNLYFGNEYPVTQDRDFDGNGIFNKDDSIYLLFHIFFGDDYPIEIYG